MTDNICYETPFIKEVVLRIDFSTHLQSVTDGISASLSKSILENFPIPEPQTIQAQEFQFSGAEMKASTKEMKQWVFHGREREKSITIGNQSVILMLRKYESYEKLYEEIESVLELIFNENKEIVASRVGLRYVNIIDVQEASPLEWKVYINEKILGIIDFHEAKNLTRIFHILEFNFDGQSVKYQFGIANPDYPAPIRKKQFVLDLDSYFNGAFELKEILENIECSHSKIQEIFEESITEKTRELMVKS